MVEYDPMSAEVKQDQERYFRELRTSCPVHHHVLPESEAQRINANPLVAHPTDEFWSVFRWEDCVWVLERPREFPSKDGPGPERLIPLTEGGMLIFADGMAHSRQRRVVARAFTQRSVDVVKPWIQALADELVGEIAERGSADIMADFAVPLSVRTVAHIMGVADDRVDDFKRWGDATFGALGGDAAAAAEGFAAMQEMFAYLNDLIGERRAILAAGAEPPEDVMTALMAVDTNGLTFSDDEIMWACLLTTFAGFETTSTAIASAVHLLCTNPEERRKLEENPDLLDTAAEEVVRYAAPLEGLFRTSATDTEIGGVKLPADAKIRVVYASANHDESVFSDADRFRVDREPEELRRHVGFGRGTHICLGAPLARAELKAAMATLLRRLPGFELDPTRSPVRKTVLLANGFASMPIRWDPAKVVGAEPEHAAALG